MQIIAKEGQSLADIALQYLGSVEGVFTLAEKNNLQLTQRLKDGQVLEYDVPDIINEKIVKNYAVKNIEPATDISLSKMKVLMFNTDSVIQTN